MAFVEAILVRISFLQPLALKALCTLQFTGGELHGYNKSQGEYQMTHVPSACAYT